MTTHYLKKQGIYQELIQRYLKSGWLERFGFGAFMRPGAHITWEAALSAVQSQLCVPVHVGARTALESKGKAHYVRFGKKGNLFLFGLRGEKKLPKWFLDGPWRYNFQITYNDLFIEAPKQSLSLMEIKSGRLIVSSPERAAFEMLYHIPSLQTFDEASLIFENFVTFRTKLVQKLLESCNSVKVKRLFLYFTKKHNHQWLDKLDLSKIDLGSGKREIIKGGRFDKKYMITVSNFTDEEFHREQV